MNASQKDFQTIIEFVVDMRSSLDIKSILGFENDVKFDDLSSKTVDEIYTYVKSILGAVSSFSEKLTAENKVEMVFTVSCDRSELPESVLSYII